MNYQRLLAEQHSFLTREVQKLKEAIRAKTLAQSPVRHLESPAHPHSRTSELSLKQGLQPEQQLAQLEEAASLQAEIDQVRKTVTGLRDELDQVIQVGANNAKLLSNAELKRRRELQRLEARLAKEQRNYDQVREEYSRLQQVAAQFADEAVNVEQTLVELEEKKESQNWRDKLQSQWKREQARRQTLEGLLQRQSTEMEGRLQSVMQGLQQVQEENEVLEEELRQFEEYQDKQRQILQQLQLAIKSLGQDDEEKQAPRGSKVTNLALMRRRRSEALPFQSSQRQFEPTRQRDKTSALNMARRVRTDESKEIDQQLVSAPVTIEQTIDPAPQKEPEIKKAKFRKVDTKKAAFVFRTKLRQDSKEDMKEIPGPRRASQPIPIPQSVLKQHLQKNIQGSARRNLTQQSLVQPDKDTSSRMQEVSRYIERRGLAGEGKQFEAEPEPEVLGRTPVRREKGTVLPSIVQMREVRSLARRR